MSPPLRLFVTLFAAGAVACAPSEADPAKDTASDPVTDTADTDTVADTGTDTDTDTTADTDTDTAPDTDTALDTGTPIDADGDGSPRADDCNDADPAIYPGAPEPDCTDPTDYDCDGAVLYADVDADGAAACEDCDDTNAARSPLLPCDPTPTEVASADDCNDTDPAIYPGAPEPDCTDPTDYDCDGAVLYADVDADGVPACEDCDDTNAARSPLLPERCDTGDVDEDCSGAADDGDPAPDGTTAWYTDADADGAGDVGTERFGCDPTPTEVASADDCDDTDATVSPEGWEICEDGVDQDCTGADEDCRYSGVYVADVDAQVTVYGGYASGHFGSELLTGSFSGDGVTDLLVGAAGERRSGSRSAGGAYGFYDLPRAGEGEAGDLSDFDQVNDYSYPYGNALYNLGDINGDSRDDFGTPFDSSSAVWFGGDTGSGAASATADVNPTGTALSRAGNFMGGAASNDWLSGYWNNFAWDGGVYPHTGTSTANLGIFRGLTSSFAGLFVTGGADWDGDGVDDIAISAPFADLGATNAGAVHVIYGPSPTYLRLSSADATIQGDSASDSLAYGLSPVDDLDGDGLPDLAVWSEFADANGSNAGAVYLVTTIGSGRVSDVASATIPGRAADDAVSSGGAVFGDVDADGTIDALVGSGTAADYGTNGGMAWLVYGPLTGTVDFSAADASFAPAAAGDQFGWSVALVPSPSGDGTLDLAVSAYSADSPTLSEAGAAYIFRTP